MTELYASRTSAQMTKAPYLWKERLQLRLILLASFFVAPSRVPDLLDDTISEIFMLPSRFTIL